MRGIRKHREALRRLAPPRSETPIRRRLEPRAALRATSHLSAFLDEPWRRGALRTGLVATTVALTISPFHVAPCQQRGAFHMRRRWH